jgi:CBS-domain-containing membrane protein
MNHYLLSAVAGIGATLAIAILTYLEASIGTVALIMAPFGATVVLVFGIPKSPLAQPKNVVFGHLITAFIGVFFTQYIGVTPLTLAIATGLGVTAMLLSKTTHPPAGANPLLIMVSGQGWWFLITPVLIGSVIIVLLGKALGMLQHHYMRAER